MLEFTRVSDNLKQPRELLKDVDGEPVPRQHVYIQVGPKSKTP